MKNHNKKVELSTPWSEKIDFVLDALAVLPHAGLSAQQAKRRQAIYGANRLKEKHKRTGWSILIDQFRNLIVLLLATAAVIAFLFSKNLEGVSIILVILINAAIGFVTEFKAARSMEALKKLSRVTARVRRDGKLIAIPAVELVPGDIVALEGGDVISADMRLIEANNLNVDESALTGESLPVTKDTDVLMVETPLAERTNMAYKGTAIIDGSGEGVVVAIGMDTELGHISTLLEDAQSESSPIEKRLNRLGGRLVWITLVIAAVVGLVGFWSGKDPLLIVEMAIALAVAAIPEGLPIVATIALARGMWRMARHNAIVNRLSAVETLGSTNIICTDKTGTLTANRMSVAEVFTSRKDDPPEQILSIGVLCNNAEINEKQPHDTAGAVGDPMEIALLIAGAEKGIRRGELLEAYPEVREEAFTDDTQMMATFHQNENHVRVAVKGAPEAVLRASNRARSDEGETAMTEEMREHWLKENHRMAGDGLRILALATRRVESKNASPYENLIFLGLVAFQDPPREGIDTVIAACHDAGIRIVMITGDQAATAQNISRKINLTGNAEPVVMKGSELEDFQADGRLDADESCRILEADIFARVTPEQKLTIISHQQANHNVVAMTGDGVNDAPALKKADIGVAMGGRGAQVAREAADMVLKDDEFKTILKAIEQGRTIFDNIRKFILFLLSGNVAEILLVAAAIVMGLPLPILPLQILYLNMIGDVFPALALGVGPVNPNKMKESPHDSGEALINARQWSAIAIYGILIAVVVMGGYLQALRVRQLAPPQAVTFSFLSLSFARLWHVFNMRNPRGGFLKNEITRNPFIWGALLLCTSLLLAGVYFSPLAHVLRLAPPDLKEWTWILGFSLIPLLVGQLYIFLQGRRLLV